MTRGLRFGFGLGLLGCAMASCTSSSHYSPTGSLGGFKGGVTHPGGTLLSFTSPYDPGPKGILVTVSGEVLALGGYAFPPASPDDPAFVDGWELAFDEVLVTIGKVTLAENPDNQSGDQSQTGKEVAEVDGPWAVDLHKGGPLTGKGGSGEQAVPLAVLSTQNKNGDGPFDTTQRYAFGFDVVPAAKTAQNVNLDDPDQADYAEMIAQGYTVLYVGTATFKGTNCTPPSSMSSEFVRFPTVVRFHLGFRSPATYTNCQNPDNDPAKPLGTEEHQRGLYVFDNTTAIGQVTIHTDHPFWESVVHDSPAHFDPIAAQYAQPNAPTMKKGATATLEGMAGVDFLGFKDAQGNNLPWRNCVGASYTPRDTGTMHFDPRGVPVDPSNTTGTKLRDYADFMTYNQSTQGHLNSNGLCYVKRNYASPQ